MDLRRDAYAQANLQPMYAAMLSSSNWRNRRTTEVGYALECVVRRNEVRPAYIQDYVLRAG